jgi:hypothetical protein
MNDGALAAQLESKRWHLHQKSDALLTLTIRKTEPTHKLIVKFPLPIKNP